MFSNSRKCLIIYTLQASSFITKEIDVNLEMQQKDIKAHSAKWAANSSLDIHKSPRIRPATQ